MLNIIKQYLTNNRCYQAGTTCNKIGIQIHTIGTGQGTAASVAEYWNQSSVAACVHYCVDADVSGKVLQFLPETTRSWADAGWGNNSLITIEICESDYIKYTSGANYTISNETKFKEDILRGYQTAVELCAKICKERGWKPKTKLSNGMYLISSHNEGRLAGLSSAHVDPDHVWKHFGLTMDQFRDDVATAMSGTFEIKSGMKVKLTQAIAIRTGVSTKTAAADYVKYSDLDDSVKKKCLKVTGNKAKLKEGNTVTVRKVETSWNGDTWIQIKSGWLPVVVTKTYRVKAV